MRYFLLGILMLSAYVRADGPVLTGDTTVFNCTDPTTRADGTALTVEEIASTVLYVRPDSETAGPEMVVTMPGGCQPMNVDLTLLTSGQKYVNGLVTDTDGRESALSAPPVPFVRDLANPNPPSAISVQ